MTELDPEARHLLELARTARTPTARDKARVGGLLAGALVGSVASVAHAGTTGVGKATFTAALAKWAGIALVAAGSGAGYLEWRASREPDAASRAPVATALKETPQTPAEVPPAETAELAPAPTADMVATNAAGAVARRSVAVRFPDRASPKTTTLPEELDLLHEAQAAWRAGHARSALDLLARHRATYPRSELTPERDALAVLCLCATGRTAEAQRVARRFLRSAHGSPLRASVEESCAKDR